MKQIAIINGPNLNLLGQREPEIYGKESFDAYFQKLQLQFTQITLTQFQSNIEGEIIDEIQRRGMDAQCAGIVLNAGAYTHTSIAIADAIAAVPCGVIAVHISNIFAREPERKTDLLVAKCRGMICGLGLNGYKLAIESILNSVDSF